MIFETEKQKRTIQRWSRLAIQLNGAADSGCFDHITITVMLQELQSDRSIFDFLGGEPPTPGMIVLVSPDGTARCVATDIEFPNGMVITPDNSTLIISESFAGRLTAFDIADDGSLSGRRVWADGVGPDGICLDADGAVWTQGADTRTHTGRAEYYNVLPRTALETARPIAERSLQLDPHLSHAHVAVANVKAMLDWDWREDTDFLLFPRWSAALPIGPSSAASSRCSAVLALSIRIG